MAHHRTGRALILATKPFEQEDVRRSWAELAKTTAVYSTCLLVVLVSETLALRVGAAALAGIVQFRFFALYHDHLHGAVLARSRAGQRIMAALGQLMLIPRTAWKETHAFHHQNNGKRKWASIGSYPVMTTEELATASPVQRRRYLGLRHPLAIVFGYFVVGIRGLCIQAFLRMPKRHWGGPLAIAIHVLGFVALAMLLGPLTAALVWVVPVAVNHAFSSYLFYAQHNFPETHFFEQGEWDYTEAALHGSSFLEMNPVMQWLTANIGFHHVHHLNHKIPFYRLPEAMAALAELQAPHRTSFRPADVAACLRLQVWDPARRRMMPTAAPGLTVADERPRAVAGKITIIPTAGPELC
jgi:acyl-lipid omega-6 desaturase (Delta-12 desaturase)